MFVPPRFHKYPFMQDHNFGLCSVPIERNRHLLRLRVTTLGRPRVNEFRRRLDTQNSPTMKTTWRRAIHYPVGIDPRLPTTALPPYTPPFVPHQANNCSGVVHAAKSRSGLAAIRCLTSSRISASVVIRWAPCVLPELQASRSKMYGSAPTSVPLSAAERYRVSTGAHALRYHAEQVRPSRAP